MGLFLASPPGHVQRAAKRLGVSARAIEAMLADLDPVCPRVRTGRRRYRACGIVELRERRHGPQSSPWKPAVRLGVG
ncbi:helix-turn-helix domain-containing protein [Methylobacterium sp. JK268]